jgi:hypothetical protein
MELEQMREVLLKKSFLLAPPDIVERLELKENKMQKQISIEEVRERLSN